VKPETDVIEHLWHGEHGWFLESTLFGEWLCRVEKCRQEDDWKFWVSQALLETVLCKEQ
jgi:hypothetical protein